MRLSPFRESRVSCVVDVQAGLGAHFASLGSLSTTPAFRSVSRSTAETSTAPRANGCQTVVSVPMNLEFGCLGSGHSAFTMPAGPRSAGGLNGLQPLRTFLTMLLSPLPFGGGVKPPRGKVSGPGVSRSTPPVLHGDQPRRDAAHSAFQAANITASRIVCYLCNLVRFWGHNL